MSARRNSYVYGAAAPKIDIQRRIEEEKPVRRLSDAARRNREKAARMNPAYVLFLIGAMVLTSLVLIGYIRIQADNVAMVENISSLESQLNQLKLENDEEYSRIMSSVDLDEVKRIAIEELGMQYAQEGQVITVEDTKNDYVRQYQEMP